MRNTLRFRPVITLFAATLSLGVFAQNTGISTNGATPNAKAVLDIDVSDPLLSAKRGMLIPRMTKAQRLAIPVNVPAPAKGLWVYQTDDDVVYDPKTAHGFWYYDGTIWQRMSANNGWVTTGNVGTGAEIMGTTTTEDLLMRTTFPYTVDPQITFKGTTGYIGINTAVAPVEKLDINGGLRIYKAAPGPYSVGNQAGTIRFEDNAVPNKWHFGNIDGTANWRRLENAEVLVTSGGDYPKDTLICGTTGQVKKGNYDGTPLAGNTNTPFPTNIGTGNRGFRAQYIYPAAELAAAGLCTGNITSFSFYTLQDESLVPFCAISGQIRMGTTALTSFSAGVNWDDAVQASAPLGLTAGNNFTNACYPGGWIQWTFTTPFFYTAGQNLIIDFSWSRSIQTGVSPQVELEEGLAYNASRVGIHPTNPAAGNSYDDFPVVGPVGLVPVNVNNRPVTRFDGQVKYTGTTPATANYIQYGGGLMIDSQLVANPWAAANYRGPGTVRARVSVYDGNLGLSDHVFDRYFDGAVRPEDQEASKGYAYVGLPELKNYLEQERHLPNMPSRQEWEQEGTKSVGTLQTGLWETVENQALQIGELERDLRHLEELAFGELTQPQVDQAIKEISESPRLSEAQKIHLTEALRAQKVVAFPTNH